MLTRRFVPISLVPLSFAAITMLMAQPPAGDRPAHRGESGSAILPGGRAVTPIGDQFATGPGPFGLAISASGDLVATADSGPNRYDITLLENGAGHSVVRHLRT